MTTIGKRLLSWLVVAAMVLSMVPVFDFANFAITSNAAENATAGQANLPEGTQDIIDAAKEIQDADLAAHIAAGTCPVCGDGVTWKTKTNNTGSWDIGIAATDTSYHFYLDGNNANADTGLIYSGHYNFAQTKAEGQTLCIAMINDPVVDLDGYIRVSHKNSEINIMGQGTIKSDGKKADGVTDASEDLGLILIQGGNSVVNIYGGTYIYTGDGDGTANDACPDSGVISMRSDGNVLNIFDGVVMGPETQDSTKHLYNVILTKGTINMYGGTIQNGVTGYTNASGNVSTASGTIFNLYGGTIKNGRNVDDAYSLAYLQKADPDTTSTVIANIGANVRNCGTFNMYGGSLENGYANNGGNGGGNLGNLSNGKSNILGGTIKGGTTRGTGDNINIVSGTVTIGGTALVESGEEAARSNIYLSNNTASKLVMTGGTIRGGKASSGGNILLGTNTAAEITGGVIENGTATNQGGNIYISTGCTVALSEGAVIRNGVAEGYGGNISSAESFTTSAQVLNGTARKGGGNLNIATGKEITIAGGTVANGWVSGAWDEATGNYKTTGANWGSNVRAWAAGVKVTGGLIYGGVFGPNKIAHNSNNIGCLSSVGSTDTASVGGSTLEISGGIILGDINTSAPSKNTAGTATSPGTTVILSGSPKILQSYTLADGTVVKASANGLSLGSNSNGSVLADVTNLNEDAQIWVSVAKEKVFTTAYTGEKDLSKAFITDRISYAAEKDAEGQYQFVFVRAAVELPEKPAATLGGANYTDEAWKVINEAAAIQAEDMAEHVAAGTCPICGDVTWKEATYPGQLNTNDTKYHYYIDADTKTTYNYNWCTLYGANQTLCLALLNGDTPVEVNGLVSVRSGSVNSTINILGDGIIVNNDKTSDKLGLLRTQGTNPTMNLYGGTFYRTYVEADDAAPKGALLVVDAGTVNIFEGVTIGPDTQDLTKTNYNVKITKGTLNMYGGTIQNGVSGYADAAKTGLTYRYSGNITMTGADTTFNMYGGTVKNGAYKASVPGQSAGGNILGQVDKQFINIYGGEISGGVAYNAGNINLYGANSKLTMMGGTVKNGVASSMGGNIYLSSAPGEIGGYALIDNGEAKGNGGGNVHYGAALLISGGVIQNGKATAASGASGGNIRGNGTLTVTGGTVKDGYVVKSATGGGNLYATSGQSVTITGGNWIGGEAYNGGNIYIYNGNLTIGGDAVIEGGKATNHGGNIFKYGSDADYGNTNIHFVTIEGNAIVKDGEAGANGGNINLAASKLTVADNAQVLDGYAKTYGGNIYVSGQRRKGAAIPDTDPVQYEYYYDYAVFQMSGGVVKGGTASGMANANIYIINANMDMSGGEVYGPDGATANGPGLRLANNAALYLSGDAFIGRADGIDDCCFQVQPNAKMYISGDWTGRACVQYNEHFDGGATIVTDGKYYTTWGTFTSTTDETTGLVTFTFNQGEGEPYTGTLVQERAPYPTIVPQADGTTAVVAAGVISESGSVWYATNEEALADYDIDEDLYIFMSGEATINEDIMIDLAGSELTLSGTGCVYGLDSRNDGYGDYGVITIAEGAQIDVIDDVYHPVNGNRYIGIQEGDQLSFHRIEMAFTAVTLRTEGAGIYYKAKFQADDYLASKVESFGTVLSLNDMPYGDFDLLTDDINIATELSGESFVAGGVEVTTASVYGILKDSRSQEANTANAQMDIYANLYLKVVVEDGVSSFFMAEEEGREETAGKGVAYSLMDVLEGVNANWDNYSDEEKATVLGALNKWAPYITEEAVAGLQTQLDKIFG